MILRSFQPDSLSCCRLYSDGLELGSDLCLPAVVLWNSAPHVSTMLRSNLDLSDSVLDMLQEDCLKFDGFTFTYLADALSKVTYSAFRL